MTMAHLPQPALDFFPCLQSPDSYEKKTSTIIPLVIEHKSFGIDNGYR